MSEKQEYDVIVVGGGQNGLTAASYLVKAGLDVLVLEAENELGGCVKTAELTLPGFKHDVCSTGMVFGLGSPVLTEDELDLYSKYGLEWVDVPDPNQVNVFDDGTELAMLPGLDDMCNQIAQFSDHDAEAYYKFVTTYLPYMNFTAAGMFNPAPKYGMFFNQMDSFPTGQDFLRLYLMSAWDFAKQWFESDKLLTALINYPSEAMINPERAGSAFYLLTLVLSQHVPGVHMKFGKGGIDAVIKALARSITEPGGTILTGRRVSKVIVSGTEAKGVQTEDGEQFFARKAIISDVDPRLTLNKWAADDTPVDLKDRIDRMITDPDFSGLMTHVALAKQPEFPGKYAAMAGQVCMLPSKVDDLRAYFDDLRYNRVAEPTKLLAVSPSAHDPSRVPEPGKATWYLWDFMPYRPNGKAPEAWDAIKKECSDKVVDRAIEFTTNLTRDDVLGSYAISPIDWERKNVNCVNGQIMGTAPMLHQSMGFRPLPELANYRTPIDKLYLTGQSMHPGMGINFGGRATIQIVMEDLGIDFEKVVG